MLSKEMELHSLTCGSLIMLSALARHHLKCPEAEQYALLALELARAIGDHESEYIALSKVGDSLQPQMRLGEAEERYRQSISISEQYGFENTVTYTQMAKLCGLRGRRDEIFKWFRKAIEVAEARGDVLGAAQARVDLARDLALRGDRTGATEEVYEAAALYREKGYEDRARRAERQLMLFSVVWGEGERNANSRQREERKVIQPAVTQQLKGFWKKLFK